MANTHNLDFEASSGQFCTAADSSSLSVTGDTTVEVYLRPETLPSAGERQTLLSKWDESGTTRSYKLSLFGVAGIFGDGSDGALTISSNTTDTPIDSACTGTAGATSLTATNASFAANQKILIIQMQGAGAGQWETNTITSYTAGTITTLNALSYTYTANSQVLVIKQYTNVTVNSGVTWTVKAWNGTVGGILAFVASGTFTNSGTITGVGKGFRGGAASVGGGSFMGEGTGTSYPGTAST